MREQASNGDDYSEWLAPAAALAHFEALGKTGARRMLIALLRDGAVAAVAEKLVRPRSSKEWAKLGENVWLKVDDDDDVFWSHGFIHFIAAFDAGYRGSDYSVSAYGIKLDPQTFPPIASGNPPAVPKPTRAGRPPATWWPAFAEELAVYIHENGLPEGEGAEGQGEVIEAVLQRLSDLGVEPSRSAIQPVIREVLKRLRPARN